MCFGLTIYLIAPMVGIASPVSDALLQLRTDVSVNRSVALSELGFKEPVVLSGENAQQEFYLPVPKGTKLADATIHFDATYLKGEDGWTSMVLSVDGKPQVTNRITSGEGRLSNILDVGVQARTDGFVRFGVNWQSAAGLRICEKDPATGNALMISPESRLVYSYDTREISTLDDAWSALPSTPVLLVAGSKLDTQTFDSVWRLGVALERSGKRVMIREFPAIGDEIDTREIVIPEGLSRTPAFAALGRSAKHKIKDMAEIAALLMVGASAISGDVVVADAVFLAKLNESLDALQTQFSVDPAALQAFKEWREDRVSFASTPMGSKQIRLATLGKQLSIIVASDGGNSAAGVFGEAWHRILISRQVTAHTAVRPSLGAKQVVRPTSLGGTASSFDVVARGDWTVSIPLSALSADGGVPDEFVVDVAAAPGASTTRPVASVFWNGILLAAKQLEAVGRPERITARVPGYVLGVNNTLRVMFQRQPVSVDCNEIPQGFPVNVLPSSYIKAGNAQPDGTFIGLLPLMAGNPQLIVPAHYLENASRNLQRIISIAVASGLSVTGTQLLLINDNEIATPARPFLAMEVAVNGAPSIVQVAEQGHLRVDGRDATWLDIAGVKNLSTVQVSKAGGQDGLLWYALDEEQSGTIQPFILNRGNIAIIGPQGPVAWLDSTNPDASYPPGAGESAFFEWRRYVSWGVPIVSLALLAFLLLLILAKRASRRPPTKK
ncbi:hypothetical protein H0A65_05710 [Alcaligenaceae bacterium]|nr:hypothetical protein [Alcaligenaceae bacterium]